MKFTKVEHDWLTKLLNRKVKLANMPENKKREPKLCKVLSSLQVKLTSGADKFTRNEMHVLKKLAENHIKFAMETGIPEFERRSIAKPASAARNKKNIEITKQKVEMLQGILTKVEEGLNK